MLRQCVADLRHSDREPEVTRQRLAAMLDFMETLASFYEQTRALPTNAIVRFFKMSGAVQKVLQLVGGGHVT
jgi:hypothetical protein